MNHPRRKFVCTAGKTILAGGIVSSLPLWLSSCGAPSKEQGSSDSTATALESEPVVESASELFFQISLAQWSLHKLFFAQELDNLDFAMTAQKEFGINAVEYVNQFFKDKATDQAYLGDMKQRADDHGVKSLIIMIDGEGDLGSTDDTTRKTAVENHYKWVEAAQFLGCHSIRVNAAGQGTAEEVAAAATDGLGQLATFANDFNINVIVENHGGYSSDGSWLAGVISNVGMGNCGTLPDFGNFCIERTKPEANTVEAWMKTVCVEEYDRYQGMQELMPFAKGVSAKSYDFNEQGEETKMDYARILQIVKDAGYTGYIGVEYEGQRLAPMEGIRATKALLEKAGSMVS